MARKNKKITETELKSLLGQHISTSQGVDGGTLSAQREKSLD